MPSTANPQSHNRYSYTYNNPLNYIDPSGHCAFDSEGKISTFDCDLDKFNALTWEERLHWVEQFQTQTGVGWFENVAGIIEYFGSDPVFQNSEWAKLSDAGVLLAINDGWRGFRGDVFQSETGEVAGLWEAFFVAENRGDDTAFSLWGRAEQAGVDYGVAVAGAGATIREQMQIDTFVWWGNLYRSFVSGNLNLPDTYYMPGGITMQPISAQVPFVDNGALRIEEITTPYNSREFVRPFSALVITPLSGAFYGAHIGGGGQYP